MYSTSCMALTETMRDTRCCIIYANLKLLPHEQIKLLKKFCGYGHYIDSIHHTHNSARAYKHTRTHAYYTHSEAAANEKFSAIS